MFTKVPTTLADAYIVQPQVYGDARGFFVETYNAASFAEIDIHNVWIQDNHSKSKKGVLRGLHFQTRKPQAKLVRVTAGAVYDVIVDLRKGSPTYGKWEGFLLSAENKNMLYVPRGFAHGFLTLQDDTEFLYKCDDIYDPGHEGGLLYDDATLDIDWQQYIQQYAISTLEISEKDKKNWTLKQIQGRNSFVYTANIYTKKYLAWTLQKINIDTKKNIPEISTGDIWWIHFGENIGTEINGKGTSFLRPALVYKEFSRTQYMVLPLSTVEHIGEKYIHFVHANVDEYVSLHQARTIDVRRFHSPMGSVDRDTFENIQKGMYTLYT